MEKLAYIRRTLIDYGMMGLNNFGTKTDFTDRN